MSALTLQNSIVHYEVLGRGRPLLFLHDWTGTWRYWLPAMQAASISYRAYAIDLWGFGDTTKNAEFYAIPHQAAMIDGFMEHMGIGKLALIGHGLGAIVTLAFASRYPHLVDRVLVTGCPMSRSAISSRLQATAPADLADWIFGRLPGTETLRLESTNIDPHAIQASLDSLQGTDLPALSMNLSIPCLFVHGQNDPLVEVPTQDTLAGLPASAHYIVFDSSGHYPMLDEANKFNRLLIDFLALAPGESPAQLQLKEEWKRRVR